MHALAPKITLRLKTLEQDLADAKLLSDTQVKERVAILKQTLKEAIGPSVKQASLASEIIDERKAALFLCNSRKETESQKCQLIINGQQQESNDHERHHGSSSSQEEETFDQ